MKKPLPIGVDNFSDVIKTGYYYVDKTIFIKELLDLRGKVNLFTRPRRFGKTLNMSMLAVLLPGVCGPGRPVPGACHLGGEIT